MSLSSAHATIVSLILSACRYSVADYAPRADLCSDLVPKITCQVVKPGLSPSSAFEHLLVPSRLAFLQRSASGTVLPAA